MEQYSIHNYSKEKLNKLLKELTDSDTLIVSCNNIHLSLSQFFHFKY